MFWFESLHLAGTRPPEISDSLVWIFSHNTSSNLLMFFHFLSYLFIYIHIYFFKALKPHPLRRPRATFLAAAPLASEVRCASLRALPHALGSHTQGFTASGWPLPGVGYVQTHEPVHVKKSRIWTHANLLIAKEVRSGLPAEFEPGQRLALN